MTALSGSSESFCILEKNACLEIKSVGGKAFVNLSAEVEIPHNSKPHSQYRNGPARQRRRERRAAVAAEDEAAAVDNILLC